MISQALEISILILAVYVIFSDGYIFDWLRVFIETTLDLSFGMKISAYICNPLFNCYVCMASFWTFVFGFELSWQFLIKMLMVCGINFLIEKIILSDKESDEKPNGFTLN